MFDTALRFFHGQPHYRRERARTLSKLGEFLGSMELHEAAADASRQARELYREIVSAAAQPSMMMWRGEEPAGGGEDFDEIVMIMSR